MAETNNFGLPNNPFSSDGLSVPSPFTEPYLDNQNNQSNTTAPIGAPSTDLVLPDTSNGAIADNQLLSDSSTNNPLMEEKILDADVLTGVGKDDLLASTEANDPLINSGEVNGLILASEPPVVEIFGIQAAMRGASAASSLPTISVLGGIKNQELTANDAKNPTRIGSYSDDYQLTNITFGKVVNLKLSASFDAFLQLVNAETGEVILSNDDAGPNNDSLISFIPQENINYLVRVTSWLQNKIGAYSLHAVEIPEIILPKANLKILDYSTNH
ncbi:MAG: hypothetical protein HC903_21935 [Methylacidiphilales bacterium]|nr:hypothetical protein [Candidatus Methylacidiphilales bacterium]